MADYKFRELVDAGWLLVNDGYRAKVAELGGGGALFLRAGALQDNGFRWEGLDSFTRDANIESKRGRSGDVVITTKGNSVGRVGRVPESAPDFVYSPHLSFWRSLDRRHISPRYLYYWSRSRAFAVQLRNFAFATDMAPYFSLRDQLELRISLPDIDEQRRIAEVLGAFDDLIETNRRLASRMEDQTSCLFASYGFDTEPDLAMMAFGDLVDINPRLPKPTGDAPYVDMNSLPTDSSRISQVSVRPATGGARFQNGDVLMARITPCLENGKAAFVDVLAGEEIAIGSTEFIVLRGRPRVGPYWPYLFTRSPRFREYAIQNMNGSSGRQRCSPLAIAEYRVVPPCPGGLTRFKAAAEPLFAAIGELGDEIADLTRARDELLPLLMSGRVRVRERVA